MKKIIKNVNLKCVEDGHNKQWSITLYDDNSILTEWGKLGLTLNNKEFPFDNLESAQAFWDKKLMEKTKKGYKPLK